MPFAPRGGVPSINHPNFGWAITADDLASVIRDRDLRDLTLVAHSMASGEVARYFARHGGRGGDKAMKALNVEPILERDMDYRAAIDRVAAVAGAVIPVSATATSSTSPSEMMPGRLWRRWSSSSTKR